MLLETKLTECMCIFSCFCDYQRHFFEGRGVSLKVSQ